MYGDITRDTLPQAKASHISRVLMQQGRVLLDADWNLQVAVFWRYLRTLAADLIGPHGGSGFLISPNDPVDDDFTIGPGHYYVDGILCENEPGNSYRMSQFPASVDREQLPAGIHVAYLDVWERQLQDDYFREKALNGVDTTTRIQVFWQIALISLAAVHEAGRKAMERLEMEAEAISEKNEAATDEHEKAALRKQLAEVTLRLQELQEAYDAGEGERDEKVSTVVLRQKLIEHPVARLRARIDPEVGKEDPCILPPSSGFRGSENHLYRVEIHKLGKQGEATFKWSRDNGSIATAWLGIADGALLVESVRGFNDGQWVELTYDGADRKDTPPTMVRIVKVEDDRLTFDPEGITPEFDSDYHNPLVRRWDHTDNGQISLEDGAILVEKGPPMNWIDLENGIQIQFENGGTYRTGDYWLIPARTAGGQIEWPQNGDINVVFQSPHGVVHSYAPLARIDIDPNGKVTAADDLRRSISPVAS